MRDFVVKSTEDGELDDEAQWIYRHAFLEFPISQQQVCCNSTFTMHVLVWLALVKNYSQLLRKNPKITLINLLFEC